MAASYEPLQVFNAKVLIRDILNDPEDHWEHAKRYVLAQSRSLFD